MKYLTLLVLLSGCGFQFSPWPPQQQQNTYSKEELDAAFAKIQGALTQLNERTQAKKK